MLKVCYHYKIASFDIAQCQLQIRLRQCAFGVRSKSIDSMFGKQQAFSRMRAPFNTQTRAKKAAISNASNVSGCKRQKPMDLQGCELQARRLCTSRRLMLASLPFIQAAIQSQEKALAMLVEENVTDRVFQIAGIIWKDQGCPNICY